MSTQRTAQLGAATACIILLTSLGLIARQSQHPSLQEPKLVATNGQVRSINELRGKTTVLLFTSILCPVCRDYNERFVRFERQYAKSADVQVLVVNSRANVHDPETIGALRANAHAIGQPGTTWVDVAGAMAANYGATMTPFVVVLDSAGNVQYRGRFDDNRAAALVLNRDCEDAVRAILAGREPLKHSTQAFGCDMSALK